MAKLYHTRVVTDTLDRTKKLVWPEIEKYLKDAQYPLQFRVPSKYRKYSDKFWEINRVYPERKGKYLRPAFVILTTQAFGKESESAVKTAAAMQLSQEWILIHDDIEDKSDERRGKPTLHKIYGTELAMNAGDALHMIMWKIVNDIKLPKITEEFERILLRTTLGQSIEQMWTDSGRKISTDDYFLIADSKSAYYTIAGPMRLGAIIADASDSQLDKLASFGLHLGRCFQLVDDLIDLKQDKKEGKITLANIKGAGYTKKLAEEEKIKARKIFDNDLGFLRHEPARTELKELIDFILERKY